MQLVTESVRSVHRAYKRSMRLMGNHFEITAVSEDQDHADHCIDAAVAEISRIEALLTTFHDDSQTNVINKMAGICPVPVGKEVFDLILRSLKISELTQGAFDISYGSLDKRFWNFDTDMTSLPDRETAKKTVKLIDYRNIILDPEDRTVFLKRKGMRIGFGGIGKGYAADRGKLIMQQMGITSGIVNASGDLSAWGRQPDGKPWTIGVADPDRNSQPFAYFDIGDLAVATSGSYEKYAMINGRKYSHTIDPKTGFPVSGIKSVTVICPSAELADAMATPVTVMGIRPALHLINQMKGISCIIIDDAGGVHHSHNVKLSCT